MLTTIWYVWLMNVAIDPSAVCPFSTRDTHIPGQLQCSRWNVPSFTHSLLKNAAASQMWPALFVSLVKNGIALSLTLSFGISTRLFISPCSVVVFFELRSLLIAPKKSVIYQLNYLFGDTGLYLRIVQIFADCNNCTSLLLIFESLRRMHQKTLLSIVRGGLEEWLSWPDFVYFTFGIGKIDSVLPIRSFPFHH